MVAATSSTCSLPPVLASTCAISVSSANITRLASKRNNAANTRSQVRLPSSNTLMQIRHKIGTGVHLPQANPPVTRRNGSVGDAAVTAHHGLP
jgi:hypothetical protein